MAIKAVIKYEGDNTTFVWKHPKEDFNTNSRLIVHVFVNLQSYLIETI